MSSSYEKDIQQYAVNYIKHDYSYYDQTKQEQTVTNNDSGYQKDEKSGDEIQKRFRAFSDDTTLHGLKNVVNGGDSIIRR